MVKGAFQMARISNGFIFAFVSVVFTSALGAQTALDANLQVGQRVNPVRDPLAGQNRQYIVGENFGGGSFEEPSRFQNFGYGTYNGSRTLGRNLRNDAEGSTGWRIYDQRLTNQREATSENSQVTQPQTPTQTTAAASTWVDTRVPSTMVDLRQNLRQAGSQLQLSSEYNSQLLIDSNRSKTLRLGDCHFYEEFLEVIGVEKSTAAEAKIRNLSIEESARFMSLYSDRLKQREKLTEELAEKLASYRKILEDARCIDE